jgi:hypothetical protein
LVSGLASFGIVLVAACTAAPVDGDKLGSGDPQVTSGAGKGDAGGGKTDGGGGGGRDGGGGGGRDGGGTGTGGGECGSETTLDACYTCCETKHPKGLAAFDKGAQAFDDCACATPGTCKTECAATYCAGKDPAQGDACDTCLGNAKVCDDAFDKAVAAEPDYAALVKCGNDSKCDDKP